jgi:hypothetical protein
VKKDMRGQAQGLRRNSNYQASSRLTFLHTQSRHVRCWYLYSLSLVVRISPISLYLHVPFHSIPRTIATKPNTPAKGCTAATLAAPVDGAALLAEGVALPVAEGMGVDEDAREAEEPPDVGIALDAPLLPGTDPVINADGAVTHQSKTPTVSIHMSRTRSDIRNDGERVLSEARRPAA